MEKWIGNWLQPRLTDCLFLQWKGSHVCVCMMSLMLNAPCLHREQEREEHNSSYKVFHPFVPTESSMADIVPNDKELQQERKITLTTSTTFFRKDLLDL